MFVLVRMLIEFNVHWRIMENKRMRPKTCILNCEIPSGLNFCQEGTVISIKNVVFTKLLLDCIDLICMCEIYLSD